MRKILVAAVFVFVASAASAQESYSLSATAGQAADLRQHVLAINRSTCVRLGQAITCTQAQACTAANAVGGASCTAAQARTANARIWPDTQAGREEFVTWIWAAPRFLEARAALPDKNRQDYCVWWTAQNQTTKDAECTKIGAPTGCLVCP